MLNIIIPLIILLFVVGIDCLSAIMIKGNPDMISGFKMSEEPVQKKIDEEWVRLVIKSIYVAAFTTFVGGIAGIMLGIQYVYIFFLVMPSFLIFPYVYSRRKIVGKNNKSRYTNILISLLVICIIFVPILFIYSSDLDVNLQNNKIIISGIYGTEIPLNEIKDVELCKSLPKISRRTNGFSLDEVSLGHFRTSDGKKILLFTHSRAYYLHITTVDGISYYMSYKDKSVTERLFYIIKKNKVTK